MMKLLKNANIYTPSPIGKKDILIEGEKILRIADHIDGYENLPDVEIYDLNGKTVVPGYIDMHVHITGGGARAGAVHRTFGYDTGHRCLGGDHGRADDGAPAGEPVR